jgi:hypothetical protein
VALDSIYEADVHQALTRRLAALKLDSLARWGRMSPHQTVCHLADALRLVLGERPTAFRANLFLKIVGRVAALSLPVPWPKGVETAPEVDQERGGTAPTTFEADLDTLNELIARFVGLSGRNMASHPIFGTLTRGEWGRWGYRHLHHHLTQFGV